MSSDSNSSSSTPMFLTPESTGTPDQSNASPTRDSSASPAGGATPAGASAKKARRQTAFYPNVNSSNKPQKPFSRSAAKRESVMTLGSIEHLQYYFTKTGIAAKNNPLNKPHSGLVPAIGGRTHIKNESSKSAAPPFELPPSPVIPPPVLQPTFPPYVKTFETNPDSLLPGVVEDLTAVTTIWSIEPHTAGNGHGHSHQDTDLLSVDGKGKGRATSSFEVLSVLKTTTRAIRSIRNYVLSLPDDSAGTIRAQFRSHLIPASTPVPKKASHHHQENADPLTLIRRSALEVLTHLRELEEKSRVPLEDEAYDAQSDHGSSIHGQESSHSRVTSPSNRSSDLPTDSETDPDASISFSYIQVQGRYESVPVWEDDNSSDSDEEKLEKRSHWDERLVLGSGWLYKQDVKLEDLPKEQEVVKRYLDLVDNVLFGGPKDGKRGWEWEKERVARKEKADSKARRVSTGDGNQLAAFQFPGPRGRSSRRAVSGGVIDAMTTLTLTEEPEMMETLSESGEEGVDDEELPEWAKRTVFVDDPLGRAHALLTAFLPEALLPVLPPPTDRAIFLQSLSSGQLLCFAYNTGVRWSRKPWGYISKDAVHDIVALEQAAAASQDKDEKGKRGWTFRRTDNLRLWAAALKLRYILPVVVPATPVKSGPIAPVAPGTPLTTSSQSLQRFPSNTNLRPIYFDAPIVARKDDGWEDMLENVMLKWVDAVVEERRGER